MNCKSDTTDSNELLRLVDKLLPELSRNAVDSDEKAVLAESSLSALQESGLMGLLVPTKYNGFGASLCTMTRVAQRLSSACLSTGFVWAMHCQQVAVLARHAHRELAEGVLPNVANEGWLIASVTTERGKGGDLLRAHSPLVHDGNGLSFTRDAPTVTGGLHADAFLMTMQAPNSRGPNQVVLALAEASTVDISPDRKWDSMGMRGTESGGLSISGWIPKSHVLADPTRSQEIIIGTMIPVGVLGLVACWLGAAHNAYSKTISLIRGHRQEFRARLKSDLFSERLARIRLSLDVVSAYLKSVMREYETLTTGRPEETWKSVAAPPFQIHINNLKVVASEQLFDSVNRLVDLGGLSYGYLRNDYVSLEQTFRDLKSASLLIGNDRLLQANGRLLLFDRDVTLS